MKWVNIVTLLLAIIGALNWGFVAIGGYGWDVVANVFGSGTAGARIVYGIVGLSAVWQIMPWLRSIRTTEPEAEAHEGMPLAR
jgi:hypothetical protein